MIQKLYFLLPAYLQSLLLSVYGFVNDFRRYGSRYKSISSVVSKRSELAPQLLKKFQRQRLSSFLIHASKSPFWSERFKIYGVNVHSDPYVEILKLPILTKKEVKENQESIYIQCAEKISTLHTSGTTGSGLVFSESQSAEAERWAVWWRYRNRFGVDRNSWCGLFGGRSIISPSSKGSIHRFNFSSKQILFSCYHLSKKTVGLYIDILEKHKVNWLHGYPSFLAEIASLGFSEGIKLNFRPNLITLGAENLSFHQKRLIFDFFGVEPVQHYGLAESIANFSQLPNQNYLTVDEDFSFVEFIGESSEKKIVGTNFSNYSFPLIRYDSGDLASDIDEWAFPRLVGQVDGRGEDVITTSDGRRIGRLDHVFKEATFVDEAQIIQKSFTNIVIKIKRNYRWGSESELFIRKSFMERVGPDFLLAFDYENKIERTRSGKIKFVISEVTDEANTTRHGER